jgi:uncharacterized integral membrane protein (TIGR00697 family)
MTHLFATTKDNTYAKRQEGVFILLAGIFIGTLGIINILGITRFVDVSITLGQWTIPMILPLGVLPYPLTFLCTDIISEFYGKQRANLVVWVGFIINIWILFILWLGGILPPHVPLDPLTLLPDVTHPDYAFYRIRLFTFGGVVASMIAYLVAQLLDVHLFHFWKKITRGRHLWLRNNGSTIFSQFIDTVLVISIAFYITGAIPKIAGGDEVAQLTTLIFSCYTFKFLAALLDTLPFYAAVHFLRGYFGLGKEDLYHDVPLSKSLVPTD